MSYLYCRQGLGVSLLLVSSFCVSAQEVVQPITLVQPPALTSRVLSPNATIERIAFASCYVPQFEQPEVWKVISERHPDMLILMGDNVYQSEEKAEPELRELREAYLQLAQEEEFGELRAQAATFATWDDHDYGRNDAGADLPVRYESESLFEHMWPLPQRLDDPRLTYDGIYHSAIFGPANRRVQLLMLDTRFFRGPLEDSSATVLGKAQWNWLARELQKPADLRLVVSSIPVLSERDDAENWHRIASEQKRLLQLLDGTNGVVVLSGDSHYAARYRDDESLTFGLTEFTSSSLNFPYPKQRQAEVLEADRLRQDSPYFGANFGWLDIDWESRTVAMAIYGVDGKLAIREVIDLASLTN